MNETRWYYLNDSNQVIGPITAAGLKALQTSGEISVETLICQKGTESWVLFSEVFPAPLPARMEPSPGLPMPLSEAEELARTRRAFLSAHATPAALAAEAAATPAAAPKSKIDPQAANGCAGCLGIIALVLIWIGVTAAFNSTYSRTDYSKEVVANPKLPRRDVFHINSPEEERAYQQKRLDAQFKDVWTQKQVGKTDGEKARDFVVGFLLVGVAVALLIAAVKLLKRAHT